MKTATAMHLPGFVKISMASAKDIRIEPINSQDAKAFVKRWHYSGKIVNNSQLHFGVFLEGKLAGAMQFGSSIDKRKVLPLVKDTKWNNMLELNRMAFSDRLPKNSESRALSIAFKLIKKNYPFIEWILSYADATQSGDGTIYRATGFVLTNIGKNKTILRLPNGDITSNKTLQDKVIGTTGETLTQYWLKRGAKYLEGYQLRYIYFLNKQARERLTVPVIPYSKIQEMGAGMYLGRSKSGDDGDHPNSDGATPIRTLHAAA